jgi:ferredoxin
LAKTDLPQWVRGLRSAYRVIGPVRDDDGPVRYRPLAPDATVSLDGPRPVRSPKEQFLPQVEPLLTFRGSGPSLAVQPAATGGSPAVILGVRPCDGRALTRLDDVFLGRGDADGLYEKRRSTTRLVGVACAAPSWGCFCTSVGGSPAGTEGLDLLLTDLGDRYHVTIVTEAGRALLAGVACAPVTESDAAAVDAQHAAAVGRMPALFEAAAIGEKAEWAAPLWERHARRCLACGACSFLCPTCHCFDIQDEVTAGGGVRFRCWDTCQFGEFTRMGAGHNPRPTQTERLRQRVSHKFKYLVDEFGRMGCTGCGRCVEACPVNIDIRTVLREIEGATP